MRIHLIFAATIFFGTGVSHAATWFSLDALSEASGFGIEVDTDSLRQTGLRREIIVRVSYPEARVHRWGAPFRSVMATVDFECEGKLGGYRDAIFYSEAKGQGMVTVREDIKTAISDPTRELLPPRSLEVLTRAACSRPAAVR